MLCCHCSIALNNDNNIDLQSNFQLMLMLMLIEIVIVIVIVIGCCLPFFKRAKMRLGFCLKLLMYGRRPCDLSRARIVRCPARCPYLHRRRHRHRPLGLWGPFRPIDDSKSRRNQANRGRFGKQATEFGFVSVTQLPCYTKRKIHI